MVFKLFVSFTISDMAVDFQAHDMNQLHRKFLDGAEDEKCSECDRTGTTRSEEFDVDDNSRCFTDQESRNCIELEKCDINPTDNLKSTPTRDCVHEGDLKKVNSFQTTSDRGLRDHEKNIQKNLVLKLLNKEEECEYLKSDICYGKLQDSASGEVSCSEVISNTLNLFNNMEDSVSREIGSLVYNASKLYEIDNESNKNSTIRDSTVEGEYTKNHNHDDSLVCESTKNCELVNGESTKTYDLAESAIGDDEWDSDGRPTGERWPPLGAPNDDEDNQSLYSYSELSW